jgi:Metal-dependent hydrolase
MTYNIQTGIATSNYRQYLTRSWKHVLPHAQRLQNLNRIARVIRNFDVVALQEVDAGSLRSGFINQTEYLADRANFPYWYDQTNRKLGNIARHSNGLLSRYLPTRIVEHKLPGRIARRGALLVCFGTGETSSLVILILHLALSRKGRARQFAYISELIHNYRHVIVMGDLNCRSRSPEIREFLRRTQLLEPVHDLYTFPSWRPQRNIDHILVSPSLHVQNISVLSYLFSDHLPIAMQVMLPPTLGMTALGDGPRTLVSATRVSAAC